MPDRLKAPPIKNPEQFILTLPKCQQFSLTNEVPVYYVTGGAEEVVKIEWVFAAGNSFENKTGVAAATARLMQLGTSRQTAFQLSQHFEFYGAFFSVACSNEHSVATLEVLSKHLKEVLPVVAEIFTEAIFPENEIEIFQRNSIQRLKVNLRKSEFVANREINSLLYGADHPYGRKPGVDDMNALTRGGLLAFYTENYLNGACKIFAAGNLPRDFQAVMEQYFGSLKLNNVKKAPLVPLQSAEKKKWHIENDTTGVQSAIRMARPFPGRKHPDFKKAMVLNALLGGYFGSRLMSNIREEKGYTYGIYSYLQMNPEHSSWIITTEVGREVTDATISEIYKELDELRREPADKEEMRLVKNYLMGHQLAALDGPFHVIGRWKNLILNDLDEQFFYDTIETIKRVTPEDLMELANRYFIKEEFYELTVV